MESPEANRSMDQNKGPRNRPQIYDNRFFMKVQIKISEERIIFSTSSTGTIEYLKIKKKFDTYFDILQKITQNASWT